MNDLSFAFRHEGTIRRFTREHRGPGVSKLISLDWPELIGSGFESSIRKQIKRHLKTNNQNRVFPEECSFSLRLEQWQDVCYWFMLCRWLRMCQMLEELWAVMFLDMLYHVWIFDITHLCSLTFTFSSLENVNALNYYYFQYYYNQLDFFPSTILRLKIYSCEKHNKNWRTFFHFKDPYVLLKDSMQVLLGTINGNKKTIHTYF